MKSFLLVGALFVLGFIFVLMCGCTDSSVPGIPFSTAQLIARSTDLNYTKFVQGDYNGLCLGVDGNKITAVDCNGVGSTDWSAVTNFPVGCGVGEAVQVVGTTLTCVAVGGGSGVDTNWQTSWATFDANIKSQYASFFTKQTDGNVWYEKKADLNGDINTYLGGNYYTKPELNSKSGITGASLIGVSADSNATYNNLQHLINIGSAGKISGGHLTAGTIDVNVASGTGMIKISDSSVATIKFIDWNATTNVSVSEGLNYVYVNYNVGTGAITIASTTVPTGMNLHTQFPIGLAFRRGTTIEVLDDGADITDPTIDEWFRYSQKGIERMSGGVVAEKLTRYLTVTAGVYYKITTYVPTNAVDTNAGSTFTQVYRNGLGDWNFVAGAKQFSNILYDDGDGTPGSIGLAKYATYYVYGCLEGNIYVQYGQGGANTLADAIAESVPSPPTYLLKWATLRAKIIILRGATNATNISNYTETGLVSYSIGSHNSLAGLDGGEPGYYGHLTAEQLTNLISGSGTEGGIAYWDSSLTSSPTFKYYEAVDRMIIGAELEEGQVPRGTVDIRGNLIFNGNESPDTVIPGGDNIWFMGWDDGGMYWMCEGEEEPVYCAFLRKIEENLVIGLTGAYQISFGNYFEISSNGDNWGAFRMNETEGVVIEDTTTNQNLQLYPDGSSEFSNNYCRFDMNSGGGFWTCGSTVFRISDGNIVSINGVAIEAGEEFTVETENRSLYLSDTGSDSYNCSSWALACRTPEKIEESIKYILADDVTITIWVRGVFNQGAEEEATFEFDKVCLEDSRIELRADAFVRNTTTTASGTKSLIYTKLGVETNDYWNGSIVSIVEDGKQQLKRVIDTIVTGTDVNVIVDSSFSPTLSAGGGDSFYIGGRARITQKDQWQAIRVYKNAEVFVYGLAAVDFNSYAEGGIFNVQNGGRLELNSVYGYDNNGVEVSEFGASNGGRLTLFESGSHGANMLGGTTNGSQLQVGGNSVFEDFVTGFYLSNSTGSIEAYGPDNIYLRQKDLESAITVTNSSTMRVGYLVGQGTIDVRSSLISTTGPVDLNIVKTYDLNGYTLTTSDINAVTGYINTDENFQVNGVAGITDNTSYWLCTAADCSTKCQVTIKGGIITGCV